MKMLVGNAVEAQLVKEILSDMHWYGIHLAGTQVQVGGTNPSFDGNLDALISERQDDGSFKTHVLEIKTKSGFGADALMDGMQYTTPPTPAFQPSEEYLAQLGLYLKDLHEKGITDSGSLLYVLLSDAYFGVLVQFLCHYDPKINHIVCTEVITSTGIQQELDIRLDMGMVLKRLLYVDECVAKKQMPPGEFTYKYPLTPELLDAQSDATLRKMFEGKKILGAWQARYSGYLDANLKADGVERSYNAEEMKMITREYLKRHPKSRMGQTKKAG
jgi:hypothetical protein